ncbi:hypothetical protein M404DRAFT_930008 [Pisolithus tinctorius Marx 270]|uniref:Uncharacterized protein n=1 Tax=Pisolithus tinctorius Marx 270 TaxID=870435 RepID=A0A0C3PLL5_PISTI|nr:hypothetical protein M404DRAFT_930008 [Pisolithus tinctorius Marx 270]
MPPQHIVTLHIATPTAQLTSTPLAPPPVPPKTPVPTSGNSGSSVQQMLAAYILMSPSTKTTVDNLMDAEQACSSTSHWSKVHRPLLFDLNEHTPVVTPDDTALPISNLIDDLADAGYHVPLTLFTYEALSRLQNEPHSIKITKLHHKGQNVYVLDISQFPKEADMCPLDWYSAWECYLEWIGEHLGSVLRRMWSCHFHFLTRKDDFLDSFTAILKFDIEIRRKCTSDPKFTLTIDQYKSHLVQLLIKVSNSSSSEKSSFWTQHYLPYDHKPCQDMADNSFRGNQRSQPTCLICTCPGHKYSLCSEETMPKGQQTFARSHEGKLVRRDNNSPICFPFQLATTKKPCRNNHPDQHICAICGSRDHGASNHKSA